MEGPGSAKKDRKFEAEPEGTRDRNRCLAGTAGIIRHREGCPDRANCKYGGNGSKEPPVSRGQVLGESCDAAKSGKFKKETKGEVCGMHLFPLAFR